MKKVAAICLSGLFISFLFFTSCSKEIWGCMDSKADNYNPDANFNDGSCYIKGCMDYTAFNYNPNATVSGDCIPVVYGCTDTTALNYYSTANVDDGSCYYFTGQVTFWYYLGEGYCDWYGAVIGGKEVTIDYASAPPCGSPGCANFTLPVGTYHFEVSSPCCGPCASYDVTLTPGCCITIKLN